MTATVRAGEPRGCAVGDAPGSAEHQAEDAWQLVDASHELRTPLTALRTEVELALLGNRDASELRAALTSAAEEIRRVCRLADDILVLARADHGRLPLRPRPLEPRMLLDAAAARARAAARAQGRHIVIRDSAPGSWLLADPDRAAQALDNLLSNALQYASGTISLTCRADGTLLGLHVTDQGTGFTEDIAARAFQRFTRGKHARGQGTGLGLSLVAAIASAHRGAATVRNLPEGGADACIALPRCLPAAPSALQPTWPRSVDTGAGEPNGANAPTAGLASRAAGRQRAAAGHTTPCRRPAGIRRRPPRRRQNAGSTTRAPGECLAPKHACACRKR
jgi:anti-sigma regulatory factor (Ser/Thr protein kinase)